jgi:hypothetical protein
MICKGFIIETEPAKRLEFIKKVSEMKKMLLTNRPVKLEFAGDTMMNDVLAELITITFPGTDETSVRKELASFNDRSDDLKSFIVREGGYEARPTATTKIASLREGEVLDRAFLEDVKSIFPRTITREQRESIDNKLQDSIVKMVKSAGAFSFGELKGDLGNIFGIMNDDEIVRDFRKANTDFSQNQNISTFLSEAGELLGIYFKDNFEQRLTEHLEKNAGIKQRLGKLIDKKKVEQIKKNFSRLSIEDKVRFDALLSEVGRSIEDGREISTQSIGELITFFLEQRVLGGNQGLRSGIKKELRKFDYKTPEGGVAEDVSFKGYVSKKDLKLYQRV